MAAVPPWFKSEILQYLPGAIPGQEAGQYYARCPAPGHVDRHRSFAISPGKSIPVVFICQGGCSDEDIRAALITAGASEEYLGPYGTPAYQARRMIRATGANRERMAELERQIERLRWEMLELKASVRGLLHSEGKLALLKIRIQAVMDDADIPAEEEDYVAFAMRAGVPKSTAYRAWKTDPLVQVQVNCVVFKDHVVLARPEDESQAPQVSDATAILKLRTPFSNQERDGSQSENHSTSNHSHSENASSGPGRPAA